MTGAHFLWPALAIALAAGGGTARAQDATVPGEVTVPHPTLENLSVEWAITGDADLDGVVTVRYREVGAGAFRTGLSLFRVPAGSNEGFSWSNRHSGSVFDLRPDTEYEIELTLDDPDGGSTTRMVTARTRPVPQAAADGRSRPVTPSTFATAAGDAMPGDILELAAGSYPGFTFGQDGTLALPIVIRGASADSVTITGDVRLDGRSHVFLEDVTVEGMVKLNDAVGIVIRGCTIHATENGIVSYGSGSTDGYFADNVVIGTTGWTDATLGASGDNVGEGIQMTGPGNVIAHNHVRGFRDCISLMEDSEAVDQFSIDIIGNDIEIGADDAIEADFAMGNVRVMRNRITSSFVGLSSQPSLGGPTYFVRNVMYNVVYSPFKLHRGSVGDIALHNTAVKCGDALGIYAGVTWSRAFFRNNLFIGGEGGGTYGGYGNGSGRVAQLADADDTCSFDYDGYGSIGTGTFEGRIGSTRFASLAELRSMTPEAHAVQVDMSVFAATVAFPSSGPFPERMAADLRLRDGAAAVDQGVVLTNINEGFAGPAPDLGAYELGTLLPPYGPRTAGSEVCGDGTRQGTEECDDGNTRDGDGCSGSCRVEVGPGTDGGTTGRDGGGPAADGSVPGRDAGTGGDGDGGCGCRLASAHTSRWHLLLAALGLFAWRQRRRSITRRR